MDEWTNINEAFPAPDQIVIAFSRNPKWRHQVAQFRMQPNHQGAKWISTLDGETVIDKVYDWKAIDEPPGYPTQVVRDQFTPAMEMQKGK